MQEFRRRMSYSLDSSAGEYVDLGLPSGVKWCTHNIGGINPEDDGYYFSWGNVVGHIKGSEYNFNDVTYKSTSGYNLTGDIPVNDTYDIARKVMGSPWRLPTKDEFKELYDNTDREWAYIGIKGGYKFMKKSNHSVYVFFPACGYYNGKTLTDWNSSGIYWSSTYTNSSRCADMTFSETFVNPESGNYRRWGLTGRAVCD